MGVINAVEELSAPVILQVYPLETVKKLAINKIRLIGADKKAGNVLNF